MKKLLIIIPIIFSIICKGQSYTSSLVYSDVVVYGDGGGVSPYLKLSIRYDTAVLFEGKKYKCNHKYAAEIKPQINISCAVNHGIEGCPDDWYNAKEICTKCYRHISIKEHRSVIVIPDEYAIAKNKLDSILRNKKNIQ